MTVQQVWTAGRTYRTDASDGDGRAGPADVAVQPDGADPLSLLLLAGVLTNEAELVGWDGSEPRVHGDLTEAALLVAASRFGLEPDRARAVHPAVAEVPFESDLRYSLSVRRRDGRDTMFVKGAPERVLALSSSMLGPDGEQVLDADAVHETAERTAVPARPTAVAQRRHERPPGRRARLRAR